MKTLVAFCFVILGSVSQFAQTEPPAELRTITLTSSYAEDGHGELKPSHKRDRNCFDLLTEKEVACRERWDLIYGNMRAGEDWDWFFVSGPEGARTRIVSLGAKEWADEFSIPYVEPLPKLAPGQRRTVYVDASGAHGAPGAPGIAGRAPAPPPPTAPKPVTTSADYVRAQKGTMYVVRVVDKENDFYVLMRVDDLVRGRTATISWKRVTAPPTEWEKQ